MGRHRKKRVFGLIFKKVNLFRFRQDYCNEGGRAFSYRIKNSKRVNLFRLCRDYCYEGGKVNPLFERKILKRVNLFLFQNDYCNERG